MLDKSLGLKVRRKNGEKIRKALVETGAFDRSRKICSDESHVYLPVLDMDEKSAASVRSIAEFELVEIKFLPEEKIPSLEDLLGFRPSFEVVGDIAMVEDNDAQRVAAALMSTSKSIKTVIAPISDVEGEFRTRRFRHVAGEAGTVTLHREHGLRYRVDLEGAYFTPRLGTERLRIAEPGQPGRCRAGYVCRRGAVCPAPCQKGGRRHRHGQKSRGREIPARECAFE